MQTPCPKVVKNFQTASAEPSKQAHGPVRATPVKPAGHADTQKHVCAIPCNWDCAVPAASHQPGFYAVYRGHLSADLIPRGHGGPTWKLL